MCFANLFANNKSFICDFVGEAVVTVVKLASVSVTESLSCSTIPFNKVRICFLGKDTVFCTKIMRLFFDLRIANAVSEKLGAITTSQNNLCISSAVSKSISVLLINMPPNADTGSPANASK